VAGRQRSPGEVAGTPGGDGTGKSWGMVKSGYCSGEECGDTWNVRTAGMRCVECV
jgi:hypothetical protein